MSAIEVIAMPALELGEGARWFDDGPVQVDLLAGRLLKIESSGVTELVTTPNPLGAAARWNSCGMAIVAGTGVSLVDEQGRMVFSVDTGLDSQVSRVNDAGTDRWGRLWFGCMNYGGKRGEGTLWCLDRDRALSLVLSDLSIPNGPVFSPDGEMMYLADSADGVIHSFGVDSSSVTLEPMGVFASVSDASPDGMAVDEEGGVWSALWGGARLHRYRPDGMLTEVVKLPATQPTSLALDPSGGPALVTSAKIGLESPTDADGRSMWIDLGVRPAPSNAYG